MRTWGWGAAILAGWTSACFAGSFSIRHVYRVPATLTVSNHGTWQTTTIEGAMVKPSYDFSLPVFGVGSCLFFVLQEVGNANVPTALLGASGLSLALGGMLGAAEWLHRHDVYFQPTEGPAAGRVFETPIRWRKSFTTWDGGWKVRLPRRRQRRLLENVVHGKTIADPMTGLPFSTEHISIETNEHFELERVILTGGFLHGPRKLETFEIRLDDVQEGDRSTLNSW